MVTSVADALASKEGIIAAIPVVGTVLIWLLGRLFTRRAKIHWAILHEAIHNIREGVDKPFLVYTRTFTIGNPSRSPAEDVEFALNFKVPNVDIYPHVEYTTITNPDGRVITRFKNLNPGELINVSLLSSGHPLPEVTNVRFKGGGAKHISMAPQRLWPKSVSVGVLFLMVAGVFSVLYLVTKVVVSLVI